MDMYHTHSPVMYGALYLFILLLVAMGAIIYISVNHKRFFKRVKDPEELRARLAGEWQASSDDDFSLDEASGLSGLEPEEEEVISSALAAATTRRRQTGEAAYVMQQQQPQGVRGHVLGLEEVEEDVGDGDGAGTSAFPHTKRA